MLDLRQLSALRAVAERGSVLAAAESLGWSQPTVAHHLRGLERVTGAAVVQSSRSGTRLTAAGLLWLPHAEALLDRAERARADIRSTLADARRRIRLGIFPTAAARLLPRLISALMDAGYEPHVTEGELPELTAGLEQLALDAAVVFDRPGQPAPIARGLMRTSLFIERFSVLLPARHPLAQGTGVRLLDLRDERWILGARDADPADAAFLAAARTAGFEPLVGPRSDNYQVVAGYVAAGLGVALVPDMAWDGGAAARDDLVVRELAEPRLDREIALLTAPSLDDSMVELIRRSATPHS